MLRVLSLYFLPDLNQLTTTKVPSLSNLQPECWSSQRLRNKLQHPSNHWENFNPQLNQVQVTNIHVPTITVPLWKTTCLKWPWLGCWLVSIYACKQFLRRSLSQSGMRKKQGSKLSGADYFKLLWNSMRKPGCPSRPICFQNQPRWFPSPAISGKLNYELLSTRQKFVWWL